MIIFFHMQTRLTIQPILIYFQLTNMTQTHKQVKVLIHVYNPIIYNRNYDNIVFIKSVKRNYN